jgi:hypothetical protein
MRMGRDTGVALPSPRDTAQPLPAETLIGFESWSFFEDFALRPPDGIPWAGSMVDGLERSVDRETATPALPAFPFFAISAIAELCPSGLSNELSSEPALELLPVELPDENALALLLAAPAAFAEEPPLAFRPPAPPGTFPPEAEPVDGSPLPEELAPNVSPDPPPVAAEPPVPPLPGDPLSAVPRPAMDILPGAFPPADDELDSWLPSPSPCDPAPEEKAELSTPEPMAWGKD